MRANAVETIFDIVIGEDNQEFIADVGKDRLLESIKHMSIKYQFVLDQTRKGVI